MTLKLGAFVIATSLIFSNVAFAAEAVDANVLPKGSPAGVNKAISFSGHHNLLWVVGGGVVVGGIVLVATGNGHGSVGQACTLSGCAPVTTPTTTTDSSGTTTTTTTTPTTTTTTTTTTK